MEKVLLWKPMSLSWTSKKKNKLATSDAETDSGLAKLVVMTNVFSMISNTKLKLNGLYALDR